MWLTWNERGDQRAWDSFVMFVKARCASKKLKPIPSIGLGRTGRSGHQLRDLRGLCSQYILR